MLAGEREIRQQQRQAWLSTVSGLTQSVWHCCLFSFVTQYLPLCLRAPADEAEGLDYGDEGRQRYGQDVQQPASREQVAQDGCLQLQPAAPRLGVQQPFAALSAVAGVPLQAAQQCSRQLQGTRYS